MVYEKYSVKKAREAREAEALALAEAEYAGYDDEYEDETYDPCKDDETEFCSGDEVLSSEERGPRPPDHSKDHPWD